jgi:hypothetical protein
MYVEVAHYKLGRGSVEELRSRVEHGPVKLMAEVPGFIDYYAFEASAGVVASVSVFADRSGRDWAEERLGEWIEQTTSEFDISPGDVTEGEVFASTRSSA